MALVIAMLLVLALAGIGAVLLVSIGSDGAVARNESWMEAAAASAEAGLEVGKAVLAAHVERHDSFEAALPPARSAVGVGPGDDWGRALPADGCGSPSAPGCRDYEAFRDQPLAGRTGRVYVGRVLRDPDGRGLQFDPRAPDAGWAPDLDGDGTPDLHGVTVWVRRPVVGAADAGAPHDRAILTAEARHPPPRSPGEPHAVSRLELTVRLARRPSGGDLPDLGYSDGLKNWGSRQGSGSGGGSSR